MTDVIETHEGEPMTLVATVNTRLNTSIQIKWFRNDKKIPNNTRFLYQNSSYAERNRTVIWSYLIVDDVRPTDAGESSI
jgi:hypothetical protein